MNILDLSSVRKCTSCGACGAVCPKDAIKIVLDKEGYYRPVVNAEKCVDCGLCVKVCYKFDEQLKVSTEEDINGKKLYSAWSNDATLLKQTTSGGVGDLLARQLIETGPFLSLPSSSISIRYPSLASGSASTSSIHSQPMVPRAISKSSS